MRWLNVKHNFTDNQLILMIHTIMPRDSWITSHITSEWEDTEISSHKWQNESKTGQACKARELRPEGLRQREVLERWQQASPSLTARGVWGFLYNFWPADDPRWPQFSLYSVSLSHHTHHVMTSHTTSVSHNMWEVVNDSKCSNVGGPGIWVAHMRKKVDGPWPAEPNSFRHLYTHPWWQEVINWWQTNILDVFVDQPATANCLQQPQQTVNNSRSQMLPLIYISNTVTWMSESLTLRTSTKAENISIYYLVPSTVHLIIHMYCHSKFISSFLKTLPYNLSMWYCIISITFSHKKQWHQS